jgi:hypothetical protein
MTTPSAVLADISAVEISPATRRASGSASHEQAAIAEGVLPSWKISLVSMHDCQRRHDILQMRLQFCVPDTPSIGIFPENS